MTILYMAFLIYFLWGPAALVIFNFLAVRSIGRLKMAGVIAVVLLDLFVFLPFVTPASGLFLDRYFPWYLSIAFAPPEPEFSLVALLITFALGLISAIFFNWRKF